MRPEKPVLQGRSIPIFFPLFHPVRSREGSRRAFVSNGAKLRVEIADTPQERIRGLSGRDSLEENAGLLFIHDEPGIYGIWMKDMKFPIDVVWLDDNYRIVDIAQDIRPDSFPKILEPSKPALYILEVNAGFAGRNGIKIGDNLSY